MGTIRKLLAATAIAGAAALTSPAAAQPVQFTFTSLAGPSSDFSFTLDSSPTPDVAATNYFAFNNLNLTYGGTPNSEIAFFFTTTDGGGLDGTVTGGFFGAQLFSGTTAAPTFLTGSFDLTTGLGVPLGTLTISEADGVPEPATWAMMLLGFGAVGYSRRRRKRMSLTFRRST